MSGVIILAGAIAIATLGLKLGIDFESGTRITTPVQKAASVQQVRGVLSPLGYGDSKIQSVNDPDLGPHVFQITTRKLEPDRVNKVEAALDQRFGVSRADFSASSVGPTFGQQIARTAVIAIIASLLVISIYIGLRFEFKFAVPVLIALAHDLLITAGVYALTGREVTAATVAALLTILGYSLYDTIIVFDRIRENVPRMPRATFSQIVNRSMAEVLTRSLATSFSTLLPILALLLFGGETLKDFGFALLVGVASGTYSSIFIASPVLTHWKEREPLYQRRRRVVMEDSGGVVPAYAEGTLASEEEPVPAAARRRTPGRREAPAAATPARPPSGDGAPTAVQEAEAPPETAPEPEPKAEVDGGDAQTAQDSVRAKAEARRQQRRQQRRKHGRR
jgi:SecD/SecF fusion protein